ncbi:hypothetical protein L3X38_032609 [Prunus dulcis]|uniref:Uncharacterized protein n=1 Tax=Prunus dulcis TaxID=3755 RepID=A0AAD4VGP3_PRUDU|nr:hypothetical protein L3X38_032609 [Prunus dulcis]
MKIRVEPPPHFQRLYTIIGVYGCHLKGPFSGQLLAAGGVDANDNTDHGWIFIFDQQKGLDRAFHIVMSQAQHR